MGEVILVTSGKGGTGKTAVTANLSRALEGKGKRVLAIDTDLGLRGLDLYLQSETEVFYNLCDVINKKCSADDAIINCPGAPGLFLLPAAQTKGQECISAGEMSSLIESIREQYDFILIDCPPGIEKGLHNIIPSCTGALIVLNCDPISVRDGERVFRIVEGYGVRNNRMIINRMRYDLLRDNKCISPDEIKELIPCDVIGVIPEDDLISVSLYRHEPLDPESPAGSAFARIADRLLLNDVPFPAPPKEDSLFKKLANVLKHK